MIPELFSGALQQGSGQAAAPAAAWPTAAAGAPGSAAPSDALAGGFADLLEATLAPETGNLVTPRGYALPVSLSDLWLGLIPTAPLEGDASVDAARVPGEGDESAGDVTDEVPLEASAVDVPVDVIPVPVIVQVPTGIMTAAPAQTAPEGETSAAGTSTNAPVPALQVPQALEAPPAPQALQGESPAPSRTGEAAPQAPQAPQALEAPQAQQAQSPAPRQAGQAGREGPPYGSEQTTTQTAARAVASAPVAVDAQPVSVASKAAVVETASVTNANPSNVETKAPAEIPRANGTRESATPAAEPVPVSTAAASTPKAGADKAAADTTTTAAPSAVPAMTTPAGAGLEQPQTPVAEAGRIDARPAAREGVPAHVVGAKAPAEQPLQAQSQAEPVTTPVAVEQAAQVVAGRGFTLRQDEQAGREAVAERGAAAAIGGVTSAVPTQQGGDASQNGAGNQPSQDGPREAAPVTRAADQPVMTAPQAVRAAEPASRPVLETAAPHQPFTPAQETENMGRLVESMRVQWRQGVPEATVRLNPEHLGEVTISIRVDRGVVSASFHAETPAVQQWLEMQEEKLRNGLADQGLNLERYAVQRDRQQERRDQRPQHQQQTRYRQPQERGQRFEVTV